SYLLRFSSHFFFIAPATTHIYTLSLHDALPIFFRADGEVYRHVASATASGRFVDEAAFERIATEAAQQGRLVKERATVVGRVLRSEEHTSELQSVAYLVCRLLLEKKKKKKKKTT